MSRVANKITRSLLSVIAPLVLVIVFACGAQVTRAGVKFDRTYTPQGRAHLTIANFHGSISVTAWNRKSIAVSIINESSAPIQEYVAGDTISLEVRKSLSTGKADFQIFAPADTEMNLRNYVGRIEVRGMRGDVNIKSYDSDIRLIDLQIPSIDINVTAGDIFFDGELTGDGPYTLQTLKGDVDITLPASNSFQLSTRALSENINLGDFMSSLTGTSKFPKGISGTHLRGGPRLNLITFNGRIQLHKK